MNLEPTEIALRAYLPSKEPRKGFVDDAPRADQAVLVLDTETTQDEYLILRFGSCGIWVSGYEHRFILFHARNLPGIDIETLERYARTQSQVPIRVEVMPVDRFIEAVFLPWLTHNRALCVGFNLAFDLSRLAVKYGYGRGRWKNGFALWLTRNERYPRIRIRALDSVRSFFAVEPTRFSGKVQARFLDLRSLGFALTDKKLALKQACELFDTQHKKSEAEVHGKITEAYIAYNMSDTLATYDVYCKMLERLKEFKLDLAPDKAFSPASLGKAYLNTMRIRPFLEKNQDFPPEILGYLMTTYYGGRSEVRIRKKPMKVRLMDFKSMYPTMLGLMDLWKFLVAERIEYYDSTEETSALVSKIILSTLTDRAIYPRLVTIVHVQPEEDILPIRAHYGEDTSVYNIGLNYLTSEETLWYTLADVIASKLLTGRTPKILRAISFRAIGVQAGLRPVEIPGGYTVRPEEDLMKSLVKYRKQVQVARDQTERNTAEYDRLDTIQNQLKILVNATSYGIFIEVNTEDRPIRVHGYGLKCFNAKASRSEEFGRFFNPIIATMLTSGARLMLAMAEAWLEEHRGYYAFCDTDSIAVSPRHWRPLQAFFQSVNPYDSPEPLLKLEHDERDEGGKLLDLWFYGISAKRYVLYRIVDGEPIIVDDGWSSHGLGHLLHSNREDAEARSEWEKKLWTGIIRTENGEMTETELCDKYSGDYAVTKYAVTKPRLHRRLRAINCSKNIAKQVKPFNFVLIGQPTEVGEDGEPIHPMTKFTKNTEQAPFQPFIDYNTGRKYRGGSQLYWKTLPSVIRDYVNHPESKFSNGEQTGKMKRRHLLLKSVCYLGKEANEIEETEVFGSSEESNVKYVRHAKN